jgi:hypothetical protein
MAGAPSRSGECADDPFEGRFVAFVDVLGFCDLVNRAKADRRTFEWLRDALARIDAQAQRLEEYRQLCSSPVPGRVVSSLPRTDVTMTAFSDCYLLSERASDDEGERSPWNLMAAVQALGSDLLARGILTRGAVVHGKAFHQDSIAFGPAIIDAYKLEKDVAKYPRILVTDRVREAIRWDNQVYWDDQLLLRDIDGSWFINVLTPPLSRWTTVSNDTSSMETSEFLGGIRSVLEDRLREARLNLRHLSKVKWLVHHFNLAARDHGLAINEDIQSTAGTQPEE